MAGIDIEEKDDMLFDVCLMQDSSQESLAGKFEDLFACQPEDGHDVSYFVADRASSLDDSCASSRAQSPPVLARSEVDVNSTALSRPSEQPSQVKKDRCYVIAKIESMFEDVIDALLEGKEKLKFVLSSRTDRSQIHSNRDDQPPALNLNRDREISFPGKSPQEAWRFTIVLRILELMHGAIANNLIITKRDIYYRDPNLFTKQEIVDRYVDDIACTLKVPRSLLNVRATAKGLVAGGFELHKSDGSSISGTGKKEGLLVPHPKDISHVHMGAVNWILIIEKEATFCSIIGSSLWQLFLANGTIITAKGYPDIATRAFLRSVAIPSSWNLFRTLKAYALVDYDPDGLSILSTYKYGSRALAHENTDITLRSIEWFGLTSSQAAADRDITDDQQSLITLSDRDRRRAIQMLGDGVFQEYGPEPGWRRELQVMLNLNLKAEIQSCDSIFDGFLRWLQTKSP